MVTGCNWEFLECQQHDKSKIIKGDKLDGLLLLSAQDNHVFGTSTHAWVSDNHNHREGVDSDCDSAFAVSVLASRMAATRRLAKVNGFKHMTK